MLFRSLRKKALGCLRELRIERSLSQSSLGKRRIKELCIEGMALCLKWVRRPVQKTSEFDYRSSQGMQVVEKREEQKKGEREGREAKQREKLSRQRRERDRKEFQKEESEKERSREEKEKIERKEQREEE